MDILARAAAATLFVAFWAWTARSYATWRGKVEWSEMPIGIMMGFVVSLIVTLAVSAVAYFVVHGFPHATA